MDPLQLVELLRGHRTYIQTHNFPESGCDCQCLWLTAFFKLPWD